MSLAILRTPEGLDFSGLIAESIIVPTIQQTNEPKATTDDSAAAVISVDTLKPSASTASGWSDRKTITRSQDSLQSHGKMNLCVLQNYSKGNVSRTNQISFRSLPLYLL